MKILGRFLLFLKGRNIPYHIPKKKDLVQSADLHEVPRKAFVKVLQKLQPFQTFLRDKAF